jgi:predicted TPR repeat methyltransferase
MVLRSRLTGPPIGEVAASAMDTNLAKLRAIEADIRAGKFEEAATALNALGSAAPLDPRIYVTGAMLARAAGNPQYELVSLQRALALAPRWPRAHLAMAKALSREGRHAEAVVAANKAVELSPQEVTTLEIAIAIANAAGDDATALRHLQSAHALRPSDPAIGVALGVSLGKQGRYVEAEDHWRRALARNPDDPFTLAWLGMCLIGLDRKEEARAVLEHADAQLPGNPTLQFYLAIARGETPRTQPGALTQGLFDGYAGRFDVELVGQLKYRVPRRVAEILLARATGRNASVLDLGCGTGLLGAYLGRIAGPFVGVDLSGKMIAQAMRHGIYTELRQGDLQEELLRIAPEAFDYVTANDVFIYVGDISAVIPAAFKAIRKGGALIFSCETADESEGALVLRPSNRYAHSRGSVERLCHDAGFNDCAVEPLELRLDANIPVAGFIAVAEKS